jgi:CRP/FNR family transcriptional regulator, dissimilatory nitrate respiration regulator
MIVIMLLPEMSPRLNEGTLLAGFDAQLQAAALVWHRLAGSVLFRVGERPCWMFYVRTGEVLMWRVTASGSSVILQRTTRGFLAEASLTNAAYYCEAVCRTDCVLDVFPVTALRAAIDANEASRWAWMELLGTKVQHQHARMERLTLKTVRDRLAHLLISECGADGAYELRGTRTDLAAELGVTPAALYRELAALQAEKLLHIDAHRWFWRG